MFVYLLFCLLAMASGQPLQSHVESAGHIVIVTPQAQVHLEPALRYVHNLSPMARVSSPHHEDTIVYVPAGTAASVLPLVDASVGRSGAIALPLPETKQIEQVSQNIEQIQQQVQQGAESWGGQFSEASNAAAAAAAAAGSGFFPSFYPPKKDEQKLKADKIELIGTPANTQPLLTATEARHFYSLPQVYHTPAVVDVVHGPLYLTAIRARSIQQEEPAPLTTIELKPEEPLPLPQLKTEQKEEPIIATPAIIIPADPIEQKPAAEFVGRLLEANSLKQELTAEIAKEPIKEELKPQPEEQLLIKTIAPLPAELPLAQLAETIPLPA